MSHAIRDANHLNAVGWTINKVSPPNSVMMSWKVGTATFDARLFWITHGDFQSAHFALEVSDESFLPRGRTSFRSRDNQSLFEAYVQSQRVLVAHSKPLIGIIDYETDWIFDGYGGSDNPFFGWGMFFSQSLMAAKPQTDWAALQMACGNYVEDEDGLLVFIDPMDPYGVFTQKQNEVRTILSSLGPQEHIVDRELWLRLTQQRRA
ncbi:MAG: hypothetical protein WBO94_02035 [Nitrospira sp.]|jgi:hypothetical protein